MTAYTRNNPSPRYRDLIDQYCKMHAEGEQFLGIPPEQTFPGLSLPAQASRIKRLIAATESLNILDYGSGKGKQYDLSPVKDGEGNTFETMMDYWDVDSVRCYDPCYPPFSNLPSEKFDGVISTDVLEHCPEEDIPWIIDEIFNFAERFVFANIACYPAKKRLPNGENAHSTIKSPEWWAEILQKIASRYPAITWEIWIQNRVDTPNGMQLMETRLGN